MFLPISATIPDAVSDIARAKREAKALAPIGDKAKTEAAKPRPNDLSRLGYLDVTRRLHTL